MLACRLFVLILSFFSSLLCSCDVFGLNGLIGSETVFGVCVCDVFVLVCLVLHEF